MSVYIRDPDHPTPEELNRRSISAYQSLVWAFPDQFSRLVVALAERTGNPENSLDILEDCHQELCRDGKNASDIDGDLQSALKELAVICTDYDPASLNRLSAIFPAMWEDEELQNDVFQALGERYSNAESIEDLKELSRISTTWIGEGLTPKAWLQLSEAGGHVWRAFKQDHAEAAKKDPSRMPSLREEFFSAKAFARVNKELGVTGYGFEGDWDECFKYYNSSHLKAQIGLKYWFEEYKTLTEDLAQLESKGASLESEQPHHYEQDLADLQGIKNKAHEKLASFIVNTLEAVEKEPEIVPFIEAVWRRAQALGVPMEQLTVSAPISHGFPAAPPQLPFETYKLNKDHKFFLPELLALCSHPVIKRKGFSLGVNGNDLAEKWGRAIVVPYQVIGGSHKGGSYNSFMSRDAFDAIVEAQKLGVVSDFYHFEREKVEIAEPSKMRL